MKQRMPVRALVGAGIVVVSCLAVASCTASPKTPPPKPTFTVAYDGNGATGGAVPTDTNAYPWARR